MADTGTKRCGYSSSHQTSHYLTAINFCKKGKDTGGSQDDQKLSSIYVPMVSLGWLSEPSKVVVTTGLQPLPPDASIRDS